jgi:hypothetical protein
MGNELFVCNHVEDLTAVREPIAETVRHCGYAVLRGLCDEQRIRNSLTAIYRYANSGQHRPSVGLSQLDIRKNTSKWSIRSPQHGPARLALVIYNPLFDGDLFGLHEAFSQIIQVRDTIAGRKVLRDADLLPDRFNACRIQIYPAGGGFIAEHRDDKGASNLPIGPYVEVILLLTQKGLDYRSGGAFVSLNGKLIDPEAGAKRGDLLIYDASTVHGVSEVDSDEPFDTANLRGRAVAVASVYG